MNDGYILLHRKITDWQWYSNKNDRLLFIHCLLNANWKDKTYKDIIIYRGSFVTSVKHLSKECGLTIQQTRTALQHLKSTNEITYKTTNKYSIITINNYDKYQIDNKQNNNQLTNKTKKNNNNLINNIKKEINNKEKYKKEKLPNWFDKDFVKDKTKLKEMEDVLKDFNE